MKPIMQTNPKELAAILRTDFCAFAQKCFVHLNPDARLIRNWHQEAMAYELDRVFRGENRRLVINAPPRSLKSQIASVAFPAWVLGKQPTARFICASYSQDLANDLARKFREVIQSPFYKATFRPAAPVKDAESEYATRQGGFRLATSVGGTLTGRGGDFIVIDDPLNATEANSKAARDRVNDWFFGTLASRLDDQRTGSIILVNQRLHREDLSGVLLEQGGWRHLNFPAIAPADQSVRLSELRTHKWLAGEPLDPVRQPLPVLDRLKKQLRSSFFASQYLQNPAPPEGNLLRPEWLHEFDFPPLRQSGDEIVQSWDTGMKVGDTNDYSACLTFLVRNKNQYFLIDVYRARLEFPELAKHVCAHAQRFQASAILAEDKASGISLIQVAKKNGLQGVISCQSSKDKETRMNCQTPKLEAGSLFLPRSAPWREDFLEEYLAFPKGRHDDQIDALSQFLEWRVNREDALFEFDFGFDDDATAPRRSLDYVLGI